MKTRWITGTALTVFVLAALPGRAEEPAKADGKALYAAKCGMCHSVDGAAKPMAKGSASFNDPAYQARATVDEITKIVLEGKGKMPKYAGKLTPEQAKAIAEHVKTIPSAK